MLITLVETVRNNHITMLDKVEQVQKDVIDVKTGSNYTLSEHEQRIRSLEKTRDEVNPAEVARKAQEAFDFAKVTKDEQKQSQVRQTFFLGVIVVIINVVLWVITNIVGIGH